MSVKNIAARRLRTEPAPSTAPGYLVQTPWSDMPREQDFEHGHWYKILDKGGLYFLFMWMGGEPCAA
jgi:hypothetical protein